MLMKLHYLLTALLLFFVLSLSAQETVNYYQELEMDIYRSPTESPAAAILFVHGGGFAGGERDNKEIREFASAMNGQGLAFISISYRLLMKGRGFGCDIAVAEKLSVFANAALDAARATNYLIDHAADLNIDPERILLAGSSAGAETVLHLAYWKDASTFDGQAVLPPDFAYAGIISFAGALMDDQLITADNYIPTMMVHGTCDNLVPYGNAPHHYCGQDSEGYLMLHGAGSIAKRLEYLNKPYYLITVCGGNHSWAGRSIRELMPEIIDFIQHDVIKGKFRQLHYWYSEPGECSYDQPGICAN
jgi:para-nitrobenzyl esterase